MRRDKRQLVAEIESLRAAGKTVKEICAEVKLGKSQVGRLIEAFAIPLKMGRREKKCPHCGLALRAKSLNTAG